MTHVLKVTSLIDIHNIATSYGHRFEATPGFGNSFLGWAFGDDVEWDTSNGTLFNIRLQKDVKARQS